MPAPGRLRRTVWVGSEKTLPSRSLPIRRMGISLGMRLLLRTTCYGTRVAMKKCVAGPFSTIAMGSEPLLAKTVARGDECFNLEQEAGGRERTSKKKHGSEDPPLQEDARRATAATTRRRPRRCRRWRRR